MTIVGNGFDESVLQEHLGRPLPAMTQWDLMAAAAKPLWPVPEALIRQAAQGSVMHNDDTGAHSAPGAGAGREAEVTFTIC